LASVAVDQQVLLWRVADGTLLHRLGGRSREIKRVAFSPDGIVLVAASYNHVDARRVADGTLLTELEKWPGAEMAFISGEMTLAFSKNNDVQLWRVSDGTQLNNFPNAGTRVAISPGGTWLASARDRAVHLWRIADESLWRSLAGHTRDVIEMVFSTDEQIIATNSLDGTVKLWQVSDGILLWTLDKDIGVLRSGMVFSPNGMLLAIGSLGSDSLQLLRVSDGTLVHQLKEPEGSIVSAAFSPDESLLAVGTGDGAVHIWDAATVKHISTLPGHTNMVSSIAFSPDGSLLASGSLDGTVRLWGVPC
jgi:WD40 repeat protein